MKMTIRVLALPLALLCTATPAFATEPYRLGTATQANIETQAGPLPAYAGVPMEGGNALLAARAVRAYRNGKVKPLYLPRLSDVANSGGIEAGTGSGDGAGVGGAAPQ